MARLRRKNHDDGMMPSAGAVEWWAGRILSALRDGKTTVERPANSKKIVEMLALKRALNLWRAGQAETSNQKPR